MSDKANISMYSVSEILQQGKESLDKTQEIVLSNRSGDGSYLIHENDIKSLLGYLNKTNQALDLLGILANSACSNPGSESGGFQITEHLKDYSLQSLTDKVTDAVNHGFSAKSDNNSPNTVDIKSRFSLIQRQSIPQAFSNNIIPGQNGVLDVGFASLQKYKQDVLTTSPDELEHLSVGFYATDDQDKPTQFFINGRFMGEAIYFVFVLPNTSAKTENEFGDLYMTGPSVLFRTARHGVQRWLCVNQLSMTPAMQFRGIFAKAIEFLITGTGFRK